MEQEHQTNIPIKFDLDREFFKNEMLVSVRKNHLDYGCGNGFLTSEMHQSLKIYSEMTGLNRIIGYDTDNEAIKEAQYYHGSDKLIFTSSKKELEKLAPFSSVTLFFVYHHLNPAISFKEIYDLTTSDAILTIVDYNLSHIKSLSDFENIFNNASELNEVQKLGVEKAFQIHTKTNLNTCKNDTLKSKFETIRSKTLNPNDKYFLWVGQKK